MVNASDPFDSLHGSLQSLKDAISPLESGVKHLQKDIGKFLSDSKYGSMKSNSKRDNGLWSFLGLHECNKLYNGNSAGKDSKGEVRDDIKACSNCGQSSFKWPFSLDRKENNCSLCSHEHQQKQSILFETKQESLHLYETTRQLENLVSKERKKFPTECFMGLVCDQLRQNLQKVEFAMQEFCKIGNSLVSPSGSKKTKVIRNLKFARVGSLAYGKEIHDDIDIIGVNEGSGRGASLAMTDELIGKSVEDPDKKMLLSVHDFFRYTESEGRKFFEELDRDGDGRVTLKDLEVAMRKRNLPLRYADDLMTHTRSNMFSKSFGWEQFLPIMEHKESTIVRVYTSLLSNKSSPIQKSEMLASLEDAGFPANDDIVIALQRFMNEGAEEHISYGHFRNYMLLLPSYTGGKHRRCNL